MKYLVIFLLLAAFVTAAPPAWWSSGVVFYNETFDDATTNYTGWTRSGGVATETSSFAVNRIDLSATMNSSCDVLGVQIEMNHPDGQQFLKFHNFETASSSNSSRFLADQSGNQLRWRPEPGYDSQCTALQDDGTTNNTYIFIMNKSAGELYFFGDDGTSCEWTDADDNVFNFNTTEAMIEVGDLNSGTLTIDNAVFKIPESSPCVAAAPSDSCAYGGSGDWEISCSDNCVVDTEYDLGGNNIIISNSSGAGTVNFNAAPINWATKAVQNGCVEASG